MASLNDWTRRFGHKSMQNLIQYLLTQNCESQAVVAAGAETEIDDTGTKAVILNGEVIALPVDTDYEAATDVAYAAWAISTSYTTGGLLSEVVVDGRHFVCTVAHTSSAVATAAGNKPLYGATWRDYWRELDAWAEDAKGDVVPIGSGTAQTRYYLVCAIAAGNLRAFKAYSGTGAASLVIPPYDPTRWVPVALIKVINAHTATWTFGTGNWNATSLTATVQQLTGPVFPGASVVDKN